MFKKKSLRAKILSGFLIVCVGLGIVSLTGFYALEKVVDTYSNLATVSVPNLGHISGMRARGRQIHAESIKLALYWDKETETKKTLEPLQKALKRYEEISQEKLSEPLIKGETEIFQNVESKFKPVKESALQVVSLFQSADADKVEKMKELLLKFEESVRDHQDALLKLDDFHVETGEKWSIESQELGRNVRGILLFVAILTLCAAVAIAFVMSNNIIKILVDVANRLKSSSDEVSSNSEKITTASQKLSNGTTEQAEALHETVTSTNEIAAMTAKTSENSRESLKRAELSQEASIEGHEAMERMLLAIQEIGSSNHALNEQIKKGNEELRDIVDRMIAVGEKTKLIDDIVFQTKLLSFNVSVEAARAGEHGKGFAVVAEEMTNLANMSGVASKEITAMLNETTTKAVAIVESNTQNVEKLTLQSDEKVVMGTDVAKQCKESFEKILKNVEEMCSIIKETSHSTDEQAKGVSEINKAMGQIDEVTALTTMSSKECSEAAVQLMSEVQRTREIVNRLHEVINGDSESA